MLAVLDLEDVVPESNETNNVAQFSSLAFAATDPNTGLTTLYIYGSDGGETIDVASTGTDAWYLTSGAAPTLDPPATTESNRFYDVNGDGLVSRQDAEAVLLGMSRSGTPWQNPLDRFDANNDGYSVSPGDLLALANWYNAYGYMTLAAAKQPADPFLDVNGDNIFSQLDYDELYDKFNGGDGIIENEWQNATNPLDVNNDSVVDQTDADLILDYLSVPHVNYEALALDHISVFAQGGNDTVSGVLLTQPTAVSFFGGDGDDTLIGGNGADTLDGGDGNNTISAGDGGNTISAGDGDNTITGGDGSDYISVGDGDNEITGGDGGNTINAGNGNNAIHAGDQSDTIIVGDGDNTIVGGSGNDTFATGSGDNDIDGGGGDDTTLDADDNGGWSSLITDVFISVYVDGSVTEGSNKSAIVMVLLSDPLDAAITVNLILGQPDRGGLKSEMQLSVGSK